MRRYVTMALVSFVLITGLAALGGLLHGKGESCDPAEGDEQVIPAIEEGPAFSKDMTYIRDIPLPLDEAMEQHLTEFRTKAKELMLKYPDSFFISLPTNEKVVALTFDDGPDAYTTREIVEILDRFQVPATFFFIGNQISRNPGSARLVIESGHLAANHSWSHLRPTDIDTGKCISEVTAAESAIAGITSACRLYRPPYGLVTEAQMAALEEAGYKVFAWSVDSMDWYFDDPDDIVRCVVERVHPGAIVLLHCAGGRNNRRATIEALPQIITELKDMGYSFVALDRY
ncbi:MAG TPA: polysaccharide deacetylase family protein [Candidatus Atribacteria bacterium]|nr:polysaccharide deacetylase family protein [Candidatus Atribacteria bacterium]HPT79527.1 polysaccharide deacetylase family protein [Candidatus Atribacteria bacterium]